MKLKILCFGSSFFLSLVGLLLTSLLLFSTDQYSSASTEPSETQLSVSQEVLNYQKLVNKYAKENHISEYSDYLLAIMQVETGGKGQDVMQSSESLGLAPNSLSPEASIKQACIYFSQMVTKMKREGSDIECVIQSYNYGSGFLDFVTKHGKKYSYELATTFAKEKSGGRKVPYPNEIAADKGYWRYAYGNQFYVLLVKQYLKQEAPTFDDKIVQKIIDEALKYQGYPYVFGGSNPETSFDCSGLTQWCYGKVGIQLPRTAQAQYDETTHLSIQEAKPGDLVFFHSTYDAGEYVTHVGIYVGKMKMYNAGDPIGYGDLTDSYWQAHLIGAGRVKR